MKRLPSHFFFWLICGLGWVQAQDTIDVNLDMKHIVGEVDSFDRSKYIVLHAELTSNEWDSDPQRQALLEDYDVYFGRNNGGIIWEFNNTKEDPNRPGWPELAHMQTRGSNAINTYRNRSSAHPFEHRYGNMMIGGQEWMYPNGQNTRPPGNSGIAPWAYASYEAVAEYYANYLTYYFGEGGNTGIPRPRMVEVLNEPFVKANQLGTTRTNITKMHSVVAQRIKQDHPDILVGGYSAAHPMFEASNFNHWNNNWKLFIDSAGKDMDFFSFHLYDFLGDRSDLPSSQQRRGSNIEAIMDMINHYSYLRLGEVKPWSISEYGWLCNDCEGPYDIKEDWWNLRSFNLMMMQLMERPGQILNAIPFMILKARWAHNTSQTQWNHYGPRLMREVGEVSGETPNGQYMYTELLQYFEFWADLKGTRIDTRSSDLDVMADAYVDGNKMYLVLGNLNEFPRKVRLNFDGLNGNTVDQIMVKQLHGPGDLPTLDSTLYQSNLEEIEIATTATMILEYTFSSNIVIDQTNQEETYFAASYFQPIVANQAMSFNINGVQLGAQGEAMLRLGLGRDHGQSLKPTLTVNGTVVDMPTDWRGYSQLTRDRFFGVLEIPIPIGLLNENNSITLQFGDQGGHVSSMALQVWDFSRPVDRSVMTTTGLDDAPLASSLRPKVFPNPSQDQIQVEGFGSHPANYRLLNLLGAEVQRGQIQETKAEISLKHLSQGLYWLEIQTEQGPYTLQIRKE